MFEPFANVDSVDAPARNMFLITPHATDPVDPVPKAIRADGPGTVTLRAVSSGTDVTINMTAGEVLAVRAKYIRIAGTTVAVLHGFA